MGSAGMTLVCPMVREVHAASCKGLSGWWVLACRPAWLSPGHDSPLHSPRALTGPLASSDVALMRSTGGTGHHSRMKINGGLRHRVFRPDFSRGQFACVRLPRPEAGTLEQLFVPVPVALVRAAGRLFSQPPLAARLCSTPTRHFILQGL